MSTFRRFLVFRDHENVLELNNSKIPKFFKFWTWNFELVQGRKKANGEDVACRSRFLYKHDIEPNLYIVQKDECALGEHSCHEHAMCTDTTAGYQCTCKSGYEGDGKTCDDVNECATGVHDCDDNATCKNTNGSFECNCNQNFSGDGKECIAKDCLFKSNFCKKMLSKIVDSIYAEYLRLPFFGESPLGVTPNGMTR